MSNKVKLGYIGIRERERGERREREREGKKNSIRTIKKFERLSRTIEVIIVLIKEQREIVGWDSCRKLLVLYMFTGFNRFHGALSKNISTPLLENFR